MNTGKWRGMGMRTAWTIAALVVLTLGAWPAAADDLGELLVQVGEEYAKAYASPFIHAHGPNQNSNMYSSAMIPWSQLTFGIGIKAMATNINETDQSFKTVIEDVDLGIVDPALDGQYGDIVMSGPTMFGSTTEKGQVEAYLNGVSVYQRDTITGLIDSRYVPLATPEAYIGGLLGLQAVVRYFPEMELSNYGKTKYLGYGLQWSASGLLKDFPVDLMAGMFTQELDVVGFIESNASTFYVAGSKSWPALTVYGGFAWEESDMKVEYTFEDPEGEFESQEVSFTEDGLQDSRWTLGVTLDILLHLNLEMAHGRLTTYSAGLMLAF